MVSKFHSLSSNAFHTNNICYPPPEGIHNGTESCHITCTAPGILLTNRKLLDEGLCIYYDYTRFVFSGCNSMPLVWRARNMKGYVTEQCRHRIKNATFPSDRYSDLVDMLSLLPNLRHVELMTCPMRESLDEWSQKTDENILKHFDEDQQGLGELLKVDRVQTLLGRVMVRAWGTKKPAEICQARTSQLSINGY